MSPSAPAPIRSPRWRWSRRLIESAARAPSSSGLQRSVAVGIPESETPAAFVPGASGRSGRCATRSRNQCDSTEAGCHDQRFSTFSLSSGNTRRPNAPHTRTSQAVRPGIVNEIERRERREPALDRDALEPGEEEAPARRGRPIRRRETACRAILGQPALGGESNGEVADEHASAAEQRLLQVVLHRLSPSQMRSSAR